MPDAILAVDAMGGDHGPAVTVPAVARILRRRPQLQIQLVGDAATINEQLNRAGLADSARVTVIHATQVVAMDDPVNVALRNRRDSSMRIAINQVRSGHAHAAISAGNTGALMAVSRFVLKTLPGIDRPAICTAIPHEQGQCHMLDLGANVDVESQHLLQFALMGDALARAVEGLDQPRVSLLNIGEEAIKGSDTVKEAAERFEADPVLHYDGFVEGDGVFKGEADVVVCDGFTGNVALKTMEGVASMLGGMIRAEINRTVLTRVAGLLSLPWLRKLKTRMNPERYNGASLLGLDGIVVKSHGGADVDGFASALEVAAREAQRNVPALIRHHLGADDTGDEPVSTSS
jgi:glycerol-3-phosphate acyltransferase PlsX